MLKKQRRLGSKEVEAVLKGGRSVRSDHLQLKLLKAPGPLRVAAVVSKSVAKKAVERNRLRRALYRAVAGVDTSKASGHAVCFVRLAPKGALTPVFSQEFVSLLAALPINSK